MHRIRSRGRRRRLVAFAAPFALLVLGSAASAAPTRILVFGATPNAPFVIRKNSGLLATATASPLGTVTANADVVAGDRFDILGPDLAPPVPPLFTGVQSNAPGCATAAWFPSGDPTVVGYVVSYGTQSVAGGAASSYEHSIEAGTATLHTECSMLPGTYYFAVQTRNAGGAMSSYSTERSVVIQTVAVLISLFEATPADEGVRLAWRIEADEAVQGFRVYRSEGGAALARITDSLVDPSARSFIDDDARAGTSYTYVLAAVKENGEEVQSMPASVTTPALALSLGQNYPNPFNPTTKIPFTLETAGRVLVRVFDVRGAHIATIHDETMGEGRHTVEWSGRDDNGQPVASGMYLYTLTTGKRTMSKKMVMLK